MLVKSKTDESFLNLEKRILSKNKRIFIVLEVMKKNIVGSFHSWALHSTS